jgi:class 3 adenylate cyclase
MCARPYGYLVILSLLCFSSVCRGAFLQTGAGQLATLSQEIAYRTDLPEGATIEQAMAPTNAWVSQREKPFPLTKDPIQFWARFDLPELHEPETILVETSPWETVDFFFVRDGKVVSRQRVGALVPMPERSVQIGMVPLFGQSGFAEVELLPNVRTSVFAKIATTQRFTPIQWLRFYLWDAKEVKANERSERVVQGIFLGIVLFLVVSNFGLFFVIRQPSYFYYVMTQAAGALYWASFYGLTAEYLWPNHPAMEYCVFWVGIGVSGIAAAQFLRHYLETKKYFPRLDVIIRYVGVSAAAFVFLPVVFLVTPRLLPFLGQIGVGIWVLACSGIFGVVVVLAYIRKLPAAASIIAAALCSLIGGVVGVAALLEWIPSTEVTVHATQIGACLAGIVLSLGLGFRFRNLQAELAEKQLEEARSYSAHEREKRELMEEQSRVLEAKVRERTGDLVAAQEKSDALLANILPAAVIDELKTTGESEPRRHEEVSVLFADFVGFTQAVATIPPKRLVQELDEVFRAFDAIVEDHGLEKIKTIGDAYMAAAGLPSGADDHAVRCIQAALGLTKFIEQRNEHSAIKWGLRVGAHSGGVVAGIVGKDKYAYDLWGDTVNIASRLEAASEPGRINISAYTYDLVRGQFECEYRGKLSAKGKGDVDMYFVLRQRDSKK